MIEDLQDILDDPCNVRYNKSKEKGIQLSLECQRSSAKAGGASIINLQPTLMPKRIMSSKKTPK